MKKKLVLAAVCAALLILLCGCSMAGLDAQGLIIPPKANADQQAIHALMLTDESELKFVYPKNGEYRSAVIMYDFTGDKIEDAVAFSADPEGGVSLQFMFKQQGQWQILATVNNTATQVDRVCFGDLTGDGVPEVVVGWGAPQSMTATIAVYTYNAGKIQEFQLEHNYNELALTDLNGDKVLELFTATIFTPTEEPEGADKPAEARVFTFLQDQKPGLAYSCMLSDTVTRYSGINFVRIDNRKIGVVLDGVQADNSSVSQLVYIEDEMLTAPFSSKALVKKYNYFYRPASLTISSKDIDGDGFVEFPLVTVQPGYRSENALDSFCYYVDWVRYDTLKRTHQPVSRSIVHINDNYTVTLQPEYQSLAGSFSADHKELSFRLMRLTESGYIQSARKFLSIRSFTAEEWEEDNRGYELLMRSHSNVIYGKKVFSDREIAGEILASFKLISE